jgi:luciferase family oxidoreductase group 1
MDYFSGMDRQAVRAIPGAGLHVPIWILGSSLFGAQLAAALGLPYAFASHFAPAQMMQAVALYRATFKPSAYLEKPYVMLGFNIVAADTNEEAHYRATSMQQAFINVRSGHPKRLPPPMEGYMTRIGPQERALLDQILSSAAIGSRDTVARGLKDFIKQTEADELMITSQIFDHSGRLRSYEITQELRDIDIL